MARPVSYGQAYGARALTQIGAAASKSFRSEGGRFVYKNALGHIMIASNNAENLFGWCETSGTFSSSSTAGDTVVAVNVATDAAYEMPIVSAITESTARGLIGKGTALEIISDVQYVNYDDSTTQMVEVIGYKYYGSEVGGQSLIVKMYPKNQSVTGAS